jgi:hypothetical protein
MATLAVRNLDDAVVRRLRIRAPGNGCSDRPTTLRVRGYIRTAGLLAAPRPFVDTLLSIYRLPGLVDYAIGGARADNTNTFEVPYGFQYELARFAASGTRFTNTDLVALSIGGNDLSGIDLTSLTIEVQKIARIDASATTSAVTAVAGVSPPCPGTGRDHF